MNEIRESKKIYYHQYFENENMKMLWKGIKSIISIKQGNGETISCLKDEDGTKLYDPVKMANEFNNYSKSPRMRTYFFERQAEIGSYFKGTKTNSRV